MIKVITYGTFDLLHEGHIRLLQRAKALGDYLVVGVTTNDFDKTRGKINVQQSLMERIEAVRATGLADEIIIEEYEGQKIDDILRNDIYIFTVGSDWTGKFDYLNKYCKVVYLERTAGISSSLIRSRKAKQRIGFIGQSNILIKYIKEAQMVDGLEISSIFTEDKELCETKIGNYRFEKTFEEVIHKSDVVYINTKPEYHYEQIKYALEHGTHVICESPITLYVHEYDELFNISQIKNLVLFDAIKTAYSLAFNRLLVLLKSGIIGSIVSVEATCTSLRTIDVNKYKFQNEWNSICAWGPTALLPVFQILGVDYKHLQIITRLLDEENKMDVFTKANLIYDKSVATIKVGNGVKSEGELIVSGTKGYIYVPAPWWKTDYFEVRFENPAENRRYFYQLEGEGIRYELVAFLNSINSHRRQSQYIMPKVSEGIIKVIEDFYKNKNLIRI